MKNSKNYKNPKTQIPKIELHNFDNVGDTYIKISNYDSVALSQRHKL